MSINRICPNCFRKENIRVNFGNNNDAEEEFHSQKWCDCGYNSPEEMMKDQDMGFEDPYWIPIAKDFIYEYHLRMQQGLINSKEENVRFFLKLLKSTANGYWFSIKLINNRNEKFNYESIFNGKSEHIPKTNIFDNYNLEKTSRRKLLKKIRKLKW